jgi:hypothetical protein
MRVITLDDVHCADESSPPVLSLLAPLLAHSRLLVLVTARHCAAAPSGRSASALSSRMRPCPYPAAGAALRGCAGELRSYFEQAEHANARSGHELQCWHSQLGLAECLAHEREHEQARTMAASVAEAAEPLGALAWVSRARALMEPMATKPGR